MKKYLFGFMLAICVQGFGQSISYNLSAIPDSIKKNANVVKQFEDIVFEVTDVNRASLKTHVVYTALNAEGKEAVDFGEYTSDFITLGDVEIKVFDETGKQIQKLKKKDLLSHAIGEGLVPEGKLYYNSLSVSHYPVTVEMEYEQNFKGTLNYPDYEITKPKFGVSYSTYTAKVVGDLDLRYKARNIKLSPEVSADGKFKVYKWTVKNLSPIKYDDGGAFQSRNLYPVVVLAPNHFKMDDYEGDMSSWKNFGVWYASLTKGINVLGDSKKTFFQALVSHATNDREKVKIIYNYLQKNFRYVAITLGIGGFKPFPADFTDEKKYGDCKGLSNYMQAALSAVGVKSYQVLINAEANRPPPDPDFPCNEFNHDILMVPQKTDTIWLECTSKTIDFGKLSSETENRNALVVTENGGVLVPTPKSVSSENTFATNSVVELDEDGGGKINTKVTSTGEYSEIVLAALQDQKSDDQKEFLVNYWGFKQPDNFKVEVGNNETPLNTNLTMQVEKIPEFTAGSKMFLKPRLYKIVGGKLPKAEGRTLDFYFECPFDKSDTTVFKLPAGYVLDALPQPKELKCDFATYTTKYWYDASAKSLYSSTKVVLSQVRIPAAKFTEIKKFFDEVVADDEQRIVIKKG